MSSNAGLRGERLAGRWLRRRGYRLLARNIRRGRLELDLLAISPCGRCLVVIEVKSGAADADALAVRVDAAKRRRLAVIAVGVRSELNLSLPIRFDVVLVELVAGRRPRIRLLEGAFDSPW